MLGNVCYKNECLGEYSKLTFLRYVCNISVKIDKGKKIGNVCYSKSVDKLKDKKYIV